MCVPTRAPGIRGREGTPFDREFVQLCPGSRTELSTHAAPKAPPDGRKPAVPGVISRRPNASIAHPLRNSPGTLDPLTIAPVKTAREKILQTAADLFYASGVRAVGVDTVVEKSGVAKMTLYKHFPSKSALVNAVVSKQAEEFLTFLRSGLDKRQAADGNAKLLVLFDVLSEWFNSATFRGCPFINVCMELGEGEESAATACRAAKRRVRELLVELAAASGAQDSVVVADQAYLLVEGSIVAAAMWRTAEPAAKAKRAMAQLLITR